MGNVKLIMNYRNLGKSGIKVSEISLGSWLTYGTSIQQDNAKECIKAAYNSGINYIAENCNLTLSQLALAWILQKKEISSVIIGASRPEQITENVKASGVLLSKETLMDIEAILG
jgi:aryl-alcohol dehydrogenase-like predicted oxidoreductase